MKILKLLLIPFLLLTLVGAFLFFRNSLDDNEPSESGNNSLQSHRSYSLEMTSSTDNLKPREPIKLSYKIINDKAEVLKDFTVAHERIMHLIVVREDLQQFQHLHPTYNRSTGEFTVNVTFPTDGPYRIYPDFTPTPENPQNLTVTLNKQINIGDLSKYKSAAVIADSATTKSVGGFDVDYVFSNIPHTNEQLDYALTVINPRSDDQVTLEPYLGAMGHSVIIREGSLDFVHVHAEGANMDGMQGMSASEHAQHIHSGEPDTMEFSTIFDQPGNYKIFTQFQINGKVYTTDYNITVE